MSVLAPSSICFFFKNYIEVQKYLFGRNGLTHYWYLIETEKYGWQFFLSGYCIITGTNISKSKYIALPAELQSWPVDVSCRHHPAPFSRQLCHSIAAAASRDLWVQSWALSVFFNFFNINKWFFCIFYQVHNLFLPLSLFKKPTPTSN